MLVYQALLRQQAGERRGRHSLWPLNSLCTNGAGVGRRALERRRGEDGCSHNAQHVWETQCISLSFRHLLCASLPPTLTIVFLRPLNFLQHFFFSRRLSREHSFPSTLTPQSERNLTHTQDETESHKGVCLICFLWGLDCWMYNEL